MAKLGIFLFFLSSFLYAKVISLAPKLTVDLNQNLQKIASCGPQVPGTQCIYQCYDIGNEDYATYYSCDLQAKGKFVEKIITSTGSTLYTGNTLSATDFRTIWVYPYQTVQVCFNYGKESVIYPNQPNASWEFKSSEITADPICHGSSLPPPPPPSPPGEINPAMGFVAKILAIGEVHTCAIDPANVMYCWGYNISGQLGDGSNIDKTVATPVDTSGALNGLTIKSASAGRLHTCAIASNSQLYCWGRNSYGQLGTGTTDDSWVPAPVSGALSGQKVGSVALGRYHTCAGSNKTLYCWGDNTFGQLGNNTYVESLLPYKVDTSGVLNGLNPIHGEVGIGHTAVIMSDGKVYSWGRNNYGQLGNGTTTDSPVPVAVNWSGVLAGKTAKALALNTGSDNSCIIASDDRLYCWGKNAFGQLGNGTTTDSNVPVAVDMSGDLVGKTIKQAAVGGDHTCALASDDKLYCWGKNSSGQLGTGNTTQHLVPVPVDGPSGLKVQFTDNGFNHTCGVDLANRVLCWGEGIYGQLGNGGRVQKNQPTLVIPAGD